MSLQSGKEKHTLPKICVKIDFPYKKKLGLTE